MEVGAKCGKFEIKNSLPSRSTIKRQVDDKAECVKKQMIEDIKSALNRNGTVAFTTDLWTDIRSRHFVSVTGHYIKEGQVSCYTLSVHEFEERIVPCQITQKKTILNPTLSEFNEIWHTCWFWPTNLKSQILR